MLHKRVSVQVRSLSIQDENRLRHHSLAYNEIWTITPPEDTKVGLRVALYLSNKLLQNGDSPKEKPLGALDGDLFWTSTKTERG